MLNNIYLEKIVPFVR